MSLQNKIEQSIKLLRSIKADEIELSYSGGKDSDVILELAKMAVDFCFGDCKILLVTKTERSKKAFWLDITKVEILK